MKECLIVDIRLEEMRELQFLNEHEEFFLKIPLIINRKEVKFLSRDNLYFIVRRKILK